MSRWAHQIVKTLFGHTLHRVRVSRFLGHCLPTDAGHRTHHRYDRRMDTQPYSVRTIQAARASRSAGISFRFGFRAFESPSFYLVEQTVISSHLPNARSLNQTFPSKHHCNMSICKRISEGPLHETQCFIDARRRGTLYTALSDYRRHPRLTGCGTACDELAVGISSRMLGISSHLS